MQEVVQDARGGAEGAFVGRVGPEAGGEGGVGAEEGVAEPPRRRLQVAAVDLAEDGVGDPGEAVRGFARARVGYHVHERVGGTGPRAGWKGGGVGGGGAGAGAGGGGGGGGGVVGVGAGVGGAGAVAVGVSGHCDRVFLGGRTILAGFAERGLRSERMRQVLYHWGEVIRRISHAARKIRRAVKQSLGNYLYDIQADT